MDTQPKSSVCKMSLTALLNSPSETGWAFIVEACAMMDIASFNDAMVYARLVDKIGGKDNVDM